MLRLTLLGIILSSVQLLAQPPNPVAAVNDYLTKKFPSDKPGAAVLVMQNGKTALLAGYGLADLAYKAPITPDTAFDLASVSKQFTAMAIMMLAERGKLNYDDDIRKWVPELPPIESPRPIKLRDLLNHTSGLPDYLGLFKGNDDEFAKLTNADIPAMFKGVKLRFNPGDKYEYSNTNYALLPLVVERASGKSFRSFMKDQIFVPCCMTATQVTDAVPFEVPNRANGYSRQLLFGKFQVSRKDGPINGDGSVFCTARDFIQWENALANHKLVRPETLEAAYTPPTLNDGKKSNYGFGWVVRDKDGKRVVWHNGGWAGTRTHISRWLTDNMTVVVLCNDESANPDKTGADVAKLMRGESLDAPTPTKADEKSKSQQN